MKRCLFCLTVAITCAGCSSEENADSGKSESTLKPRILIDRDELTFADPKLAALLEKAEREAEKLADDSYTHQPYSARRQSPLIETYWATPGPIKTTSGGHSMMFTAYRHPGRPQDVIGLRIGGNWRPKESGWGASVSYLAASPQLKSSLTRSNFQITFRWHPDGKLQWKTPSFEIYRHVSRLHVERTFDDTEYGFGISIEPRGYEIRVSDSEALQWLRSAELLRDRALNRLDQLEEEAKRRMSSGKGISAVYVTSRNTPETGLSHLVKSRQTLSERPIAATGFDSDAAIPPPDSDRPLSEDEKAELLQDALSVIEERRKLVRENYEEWFSALEQAFPLRECLIRH